MRSHPPESGNEAPKGEAPEATDFQSLTATPVSARARKRTPEATDFQSLEAGAGEGFSPYQRPSATDYLLDALTPVMIFIMVYSVIFFLLDVYHALHPEIDDRILRLVTFSFIMGIVALNRLVARDGSEESILYILGLGGAVALYTFSTKELYPIAAFFNNSPYFATAFAVVLVLLIWWMTNRLVHECCLDENPVVGDIGLLTGTARRIQKVVAHRPEHARKKRKEESMLMTNVLEPYDPSEWKKREAKKAPAEAPTKRLSERHPGVSIFYFSVPAMAVFALGLPVVRQAGDAPVKAGHFYVGCYTVAALMLLMLTSLGGLREYFRARRIRVPSGLGWFWIGLGIVMIAMVLVGAAQLPKPDLPPLAPVTEHQAQYWSHKAREMHVSQVLVRAAAPVELLERSRFMDRVGIVVLVCFGLFLAYAILRAVGAFAAAIGRRRDLFPRFVRRFFDALDRFLQRITRLPSLPKGRPRIRIDRDIATCAEYVNPLGRPEARGAMSMSDLVAHAYEALCALAYDLGVPRGPGQTPYEFIQSFPEPLRSLRTEAVELTGLYVRSAYSGQPLPPNTDMRLRKFWIEYERVRRRVLR